MGGGIIIKDQKSQDFFQLLQYYRHDLINEIQLMQAYLSMDNYGKVKEKMDGMIAHFQKERKLFSLQTPNFVYWVLQFNHVHTNILLTYDIDGQRINLPSMDDNLVNTCNQVIEIMKKYLNKNELYHLYLEVVVKSESKVKMKLQLKRITKNQNLIESILKIHPNAHVHFDNECITYEYIFSK